MPRTVVRIHEGVKGSAVPSGLLLLVKASSSYLVARPTVFPDGWKLMTGNVGRFLNHSCGGNVLIQPVLVYGSSHALYRVGLFAKRDIPAREELRYDYGWRLAAADAGADATGSLPCACGSLACRGWLL